VSYSLLAKDLYAWTDLIPKSVYLEYVVPYAVVNEPRTDHRPLLFRALRDDLRGYERSSSTENNNANPPREQLKEVVKLINTRLWSILGKSPTEPIVFVSGQTPRIMDPLSVIAYGHSSCTGLAIVLIAALRSVGIPARMAGTPAWHGNDDEGNHSWVEVYVPSSSDGGDDGGGEWIFLEPSPGIKEGDTETANSDDLDRDPRARWFCTPDRMDGSTRVYATRYARGGGGASAQRHNPIPWSDADADDGVPGVDRTGYYAAACGPTSSYA
jgi:transglutaminase-like putative cysteine protease